MKVISKYIYVCLFFDFHKMLSYVEQKKKKIKFTVHIFTKLLLIPIKLYFFKTQVFIKTGQIIIKFIIKEKKKLICLLNDSIQHS